MKTNEIKANRESKNLINARNDAIDYSKSGAPVAVYQTGADAFISTCCPLDCGVIIGVWVNGVLDGRYLSLFNR